jgi:transposase-like protein
MTCPICNSELDQLGSGVNGRWVPNEYYRCPDCPTGKNRYEKVTGDKVVPSNWNA